MKSLEETNATRMQQVLDVLEERGKTPTSEIAAELGVTDNSVRQAVGRLRKRDLVVSLPGFVVGRHENIHCLKEDIDE